MSLLFASPVSSGMGIQQLSPKAWGALTWTTAEASMFPYVYMGNQKL